MMPAASSQQKGSPDRLLVDRYRCPESMARFALAADPSENAGYFAFGDDITLYGRVACGSPSPLPSRTLYDASQAVALKDSTVHLPFDPTEIIEALHYERYAAHLRPDRPVSPASALLRTAYYFLRPLLPVAIRRHMQKAYLRDWRKMTFPTWPVDGTVEMLLQRLLALTLNARALEPVPFIWFWPDGADACLILTHDVETAVGRDFCAVLMDLDESFGMKASFQLIPERRYTSSEAFRQQLLSRGFEINIHDLDHAGDLFKERQEFQRRAKRINSYARAFGAQGFRSGALYRNLDWYDALEVSYDMSVPSVAHLEPQRGGCCTVMPYFVGRILELPLTTTQDYTLLHILGSYSIELWKQQIDLIRTKHGLISFNVHPDYIIEKRARAVYVALLEHISRLAAGIWVTLPAEVNRWWRQRRAMELVRTDHGWEIRGEGKERARIAYATLENDRVIYRFAGDI